MHVIAERVGPGARDHRGPLAEARRGDGDVGGAAAEKLVEVLDLDDAPVGGRVEVDADAADGQDIEGRANAHVVRFRPRSGAAREDVPTSHVDAICQDNNT